MKKKIRIMSLCLLFFILGFFYLQVSHKPTICNVITCSDAKGYTTNLSITANKLIIFNQNKLQQELIDGIRKNNFKNMLFSYDVMGYPRECNVTVYTNKLAKKLGIPAFTFRYALNP